MAMAYGLLRAGKSPLFYSLLPAQLPDYLKFPYLKIPPL
jgi:hypothetical protein